MLYTLLIILILLIPGARPTWPYSSDWGYYPSGGLGLPLIIPDRPAPDRQRLTRRPKTADERTVRPTVQVRPHVARMIISPATMVAARRQEATLLDLCRIAATARSERPATRSSTAQGCVVCSASCCRNCPPDKKNRGARGAAGPDGAKFGRKQRKHVGHLPEYSNEKRMTPRSQACCDRATARMNNGYGSSSMESPTANRPPSTTSACTPSSVWP